MRFYLFILLLSLFACKNPTEIDKILAGSFLPVVDTFAYKTYSLRPVDSTDFSNFNKPGFIGKNPAIIISDTLSELTKEDENLINKASVLIDSYNTKIINSLLVNGQRINSSRVSSSFPKTIGKYHLYFSETPHDLNSIPIGKLAYSEVLISQDNQYSLYVISISSGLKSGIKKMVLLKKTQDRYLLLDSMELVVW